MFPDLCLNGGDCKWNALGEIPSCECPDNFEGDRCQSELKLFIKNKTGSNHNISTDPNISVFIFMGYLEFSSDPVVRVIDIFPNRDTGPFGPESGGTNITVTGSHLKLTGKNSGSHEK